MKRKAAITAALLLMLFGGVVLRIHQGRWYMQEQIDRLAAQGDGVYAIHAYDYLIISEWVGLGFTIQARKPVVGQSVYHDRYHVIEIDFPWLPFLYRPVHRI